MKGDSGGPLEYLYEDGKYRQIGITSFGSGLGCEIGMHAAFTRVESFLQWVETNTGIAVDPWMDKVGLRRLQKDKKPESDYNLN